MAAKKTTPEELGEMLAHVAEHMATKDDIADLKGEMVDRFEHVDTQFQGIDERLRNVVSEITVRPL